MILNGHRLEKRVGKFRRQAGAGELAFNHTGGCGDSHSLESLESEGTRHEISKVVVIFESRFLSRYGIALEISRDDEKTVYLAPANRGHGVGIAFKFLGDVDQFSGVEVAGDGTRHWRMVKVDHSRRHFQRQARIEQAHEKKDDAHRHHKGHEQVHPARTHAENLTADCWPKSDLHFQESERNYEFISYTQWSCLDVDRELFRQGGP